MSKKIALVTLVFGVLVLIPREVAAFELRKFFNDPVRGVEGLIYTPCELHDRKVAKRKKLRREMLEKRDKEEAERKAKETARKAREGSTEWQQRQKRKKELQELLAQQNVLGLSKPKELELGMDAFRESLNRQDALQEELRLLQEADERAEVCGE